MSSFALGWLVLAPITFIVLCFIDAPYGRHGRAGWGPKVSARLGWILMEAPSAMIFATLWARGAALDGRLVWLAMWELHYVYRAFVYPLLQRGAPSPMPIAIAMFGAGFNLVNATLNGAAAAATAPIFDGRFFVGVTIFVAGMAINWWADAKLRRLRAAGGGYQIPRGGLYEWISCPNYFGEIVEWCGWAIATWNLAGLSFAVWTIANLAPRARANHRWYREKFADYPRERRALVPFVY